MWKSRNLGKKAFDPRVGWHGAPAAVSDMNDVELNVHTCEKAQRGTNSEGNNNCLVAQHQQGINFHKLEMRSSPQQFIRRDLHLQFIQTSRKCRSPNLICERKHH